MISIPETLWKGTMVANTVCLSLRIHSLKQRHDDAAACIQMLPQVAGCRPAVLGKEGNYVVTCLHMSLGEDHNLVA